MKKIASVLLITTILTGLTACNKTPDKNKKDKTKATDIVETKEFDDTMVSNVVSDLKEQNGLMFSARNGNSGETCMDDDYWSNTRYEVSYDGTLTCKVSYNLSGIRYISMLMCLLEFAKLYRQMD